MATPTIHTSSSRQVSILALTFLGIGGASILGGIVLIVLGLAGGAAIAVAGDAGSGVATSTIGLIAGIVMAVGGIPELFAWYGLANRRPWGRLLGIVFCTMSLAAFPIGTAFGAWGL